MTAGMQDQQRLARPPRMRFRAASRQPSRPAILRVSDSYSLFSILSNIEQTLESAPSEDLRKLADQIGGQQTSRSQGLATVEVERAAFEIPYFAAGFFDNQYTRDGVPGIEIELPEA